MAIKLVISNRESMFGSLYRDCAENAHLRVSASSITLQVHPCKLRLKSDEPPLNPSLIKITAAGNESSVAEQTAL